MFIQIKDRQSMNKRKMEDAGVEAHIVLAVYDQLQSASWTVHHEQHNQRKRR